MSSGQLETLSDGAARSDAERQFLRPGRWWHAQDDRIICDLCPRECKLHDGDRGFCFVRQNLSGRMALTTYGRSTGFCIDPIEKKPLNHFFPGTSVLSFGTAGCNLGCKFCQNWDISKSREVERLSSVAMPRAIARAAGSLGCHSVAFTYNDPVIWAEYAIDTARACHELGIKTVAVTAGYITEQARAPFFSAMDAANVDLKAFTEDFYYKLTLSHLDPVLNTIRWLRAETDVWFEITNLIIPDANDDPGEVQRLCDWVLEAVGDTVPVHFTAFHPDYRMTDRPRTPVETLDAAREIALQAGLKFVYTGNVDDVTRQSTYCPQCGRIVIERNWYELGSYALDGNQCRHCGHEIAGHFRDRPGSWGRKRMPVDMRRFIDSEDVVPDPSLEAGPRSGGRVFDNPTAADSQPVSSSTGRSDMPSATIDPDGLTDEQKPAVLDAAAEFLTAAIDDRTPDPKDAAIAGLGGRFIPGTFICLKRHGQLRACCGTMGRAMTLSESLAHSAERTAKNDPRFPPVSPSELEFLRMDVWLLGTSRKVEEKGEARIGAVKVGRDGLQVIRGSHRGLLLPGVPIEHGWTEEEFLSQTCIKAGLSPTAWKDDSTTLLRFSGQALSRPLVPPGQSCAAAPARRPLDAREFAQCAQHCRRNVETLLAGGVPTYYVPEVPDANVSGVAVFVTRPEAENEITLSRVSWNRTVPLQSTLHALCEDAARVLARSERIAGRFNVRLAIAHDPAMHGRVQSPDLSGIDSAHRGVLVIQGDRSAFMYDPGTTAQELTESGLKSAGIPQAGGGQVLSLAVQTNHEKFAVISRPGSAAGTDTRPPAVAGTFYPADAAKISAMLDDLLAGDVPPGRYAAAMVPHAGWRYSGRIAADVLKHIEIPERVIVIGPKHTRPGVEWAVAPHRIWSLPSGDVASDRELAEALVAAIPDLQLDAAAHEREHGIEVELPLIHRLAPATKVVGITLGGGDLQRCATFADGLANLVGRLPEPPLLLISSDMNHFASDTETRRLDEMALAAMDRLDADTLYRTCRENDIGMCGVFPAVVVMKTLERLNRLNQCVRVGYATSFDTTGDAGRVVGYAGVLFD